MTQLNGIYPAIPEELKPTKVYTVPVCFEVLAKSPEEAWEIINSIDFSKTEMPNGVHTTQVDEPEEVSDKGTE